MVLLAAVVILGAAVYTAQAHGTCFAGVSYHDSGTDHNYVKFQVNMSSQGWHLHREWWAVFPADLWAWPDTDGVAKAGIRGTDWNPPYSPSGYKLCAS